MGNHIVNDPETHKFDDVTQSGVYFGVFWNLYKCGCFIHRNVSNLKQEDYQQRLAEVRKELAAEIKW